MMFKTHRVIIILICLILFTFIDVSMVSGFLFLIIAIIASMMPDIDNPYSKIGKNIKLVGHLFMHRGFFHSLLALFLFSYLFSLFFSPFYTTAFFIGYLSHLFLDSLTTKGIYLLYPFDFKLRGFFKTNALFEKSVFVVSAFIVIVLAIKYLFHFIKYP